MKRFSSRLALQLILFVSVFQLTPVLQAADTLTPKTITIGFIPGGDPELLKTQALTFAEMVQNQTGLATNVYISRNYSGLIEAMKSKKVDFAFFSAMTFVFAEKEAGAKVLMKKVRETPFYYSAILVRKNSGIKTVQQLKGKRFTFVDEKSASGYLYPKVYLLSKGLDPVKSFSNVEFSGHHSKSSGELKDGNTDAIAVYANDPKGIETAYTKLSSAPPVKVLWTSEPIPNDAFCVRQDFYDQFPKATHDVMFSIIELQENPKTGEAFKKTMDAKSMMLATSQQYEPVRKMVRTLELKPE